VCEIDESTKMNAMYATTGAQRKRRRFVRGFERLERFERFEGLDRFDDFDGSEEFDRFRML
jgi:hypothetical protein